MGHQEALGIGERLLAGSLAGAIAQSSIYPMEVSAAPPSAPNPNLNPNPPPPPRS